MTQTKVKLNIHTFLQCLLLCRAHHVRCVPRQSTISSSCQHPVRKFGALFVLSVIGRLPRNPFTEFIQYDTYTHTSYIYNIYTNTYIFYFLKRYVKSILESIEVFFHDAD